MKRLAMVLAVVMAAVVLAFAHGEGESVPGTVIAITDFVITVRTTGNTARAIALNEQTMVIKGVQLLSVEDARVGDRVLRVKDVRVGDRVVVDVDIEEAVAELIKVGAEPEAVANMPPALAPRASSSTSTRSKTTPTSQAAATRLEITFKSRPSPPKTGDNQWEVTVTRPDGKPVSDADVSVLFVMPAMPQMKMPEVRNEVKLKPAADGKYTGSRQGMVAGQWNVTVRVKQNGKEIGQKKLTVAAK